MKRKWVAALLVAIAFTAFGAPIEAQGAKPKKASVAVMNFEYGTLNNWWGQYDIGKGMADQVVDALVNDGSFRVIERKQLDAVLAEQDFAQSNRAAPSAATLAKIGKVQGIKYIITGSITKFSTEKGDKGGSIGGLHLGVGKAKSEVNLTARMVDVTSGEVVASAKGHGESNKGGGLSFGRAGSGSFAMGSNEFRESALGDAQEMACNELVKLLAAKKDRLE